jgi:hypothetical protein
MPRAFKADPDHPAIAYLVRLHADLGGQIQANKAEAKRLAEAMRHVEAVIKLYDPDYSVRTISARRRVQGNPWFKRGTMFRHALDALRNANAPMTVREVTGAVMASHGIADATAKQRNGLEAALRSCLEHNVGKTVQRIGEGVPKRWQIIK